jgi:hypothetical protein
MRTIFGREPFVIADADSVDARRGMAEFERVWRLLFVKE